VPLGLILWIASFSPSAIAGILLVAMIALVIPLMISRCEPARHLWDRSMLMTGKGRPLYANLWLWWVFLALILVGIYINFW